MAHHSCLAGTRTLLEPVEVLVPVLGAFGWVQMEFVFAGNLSAADIHPSVSPGEGFWNAEHLWLHGYQIIQTLGLLLFATGFSWVLAECDKFREEHFPTITVGEKRVLRR